MFAAESAAVVGAVHPFAQVAPGGVGHERYVARRVQREEPSLFPGRFGLGGRAFPHGLRQPGQLRFVGQTELPFVGRREHVLFETQHQLRKFAGDGAVFAFLFRREIGARTDETLVSLDEQGALFGSHPREPGSLGRVIHRFHPPEQPLVEHDVVGEIGQHRREFHRERLHRVAGFRAVQIVKDIQHALQRLLGEFQCDDGILERGLVGVRRDVIDGTVAVYDEPFDGRAVMFEPYFLERRNAVRRFPVRQQRIGMVVGAGASGEQGRGTHKGRDGF